MQGYDEYIVAYGESRDVLDYEGIIGIGQLVILERPILNHAVILDGQVIGHWRRRVTPKDQTIEVHRLRPQSKPELAAVEQAAERYAQLTGLATELRFIDEPSY
jgi:hypothetical protein